MSGVKRALKAVITGGKSEVEYRREKEAREAAERQAREAEEAARKQAELEAAQSAAQTAAGAVGVAEGEGLQTGADQTTATQKKKLKGGKKSLSISRASGSGINI